MITAAAANHLPKTRIFVDPERLLSDRAILSENACRRIKNVLRLSIGDELIVFDGQGREALGVLETYQGESAIVRVLHDLGTSTESSLDITIAPCLAKGKKNDLVVEKAVELGANRICVITSARSVAKLKPETAIERVERWRRVAVSAAEQSGRAHVPIVDRMRTFEEFVASKPSDALGILFTTGADPDPPATLRQRYPDTFKVVAIVGPEGGFERSEIELAREHGFTPVGIGPRVLRAETAAIVAVAVCQHLWGDLGRKPPAARRFSL